MSRLVGFWNRLFPGRSGQARPDETPARPALLVELVADKGRLEADLAALRAELAAAREDLQAANADLAGRLSEAAGELSSQLAEAKAELTQELGTARGDVNRLGREQFRVTTLLEHQGGTLEELEAAWRDHLAQREHELAELRRELRQVVDGLEMKAWLGLLESLLPVADALDESVRWGEELLRELERPRPAPSLWAFVQTSWRQHRLAAGSNVEQAAAFRHWLQGIQLVQRRLASLLGREGVRPIPALGRPFDPRLHVAVDVEPIGRGQEAVADGTVSRVELAGYLLGDRVLRHAEVVVARAAGADARTDGEGSGTVPEEHDWELLANGSSAGQDRDQQVTSEME